ncbi:MAG: helix-turn-helix transcriptional regulator [Polyangiales bacterium]
MKSWTALKNKTLSPERQAKVRAEVDRELLTMSLRELRDLAGKTQVELAEAAEVAQSELSRIERRDDHMVSTLRRYVEALGGELEVVAVIGNKRIALQGV